MSPEAVPRTGPKVAPETGPKVAPETGPKTAPDPRPGAGPASVPSSAADGGRGAAGAFDGAGAFGAAGAFDFGATPLPDHPSMPDHPLLRDAVPRPSGEAAVSVEFGDAIDPALQARARALADALHAAAPRGLVGALPTYRSTLVEFDPAMTDAAAILAALPPDAGSAAVPPPRRWVVPVCLDDAVAEDIAEAALRLGLDADELRARLLGSTLSVGMYGFAPGFAYLSGLDPALDVPRRAAPRAPVAPGTLIIAAGQAAIVPATMPTGWYAVGRAAARMFDPARTDAGEPPVPFAPGDAVTFERVDADALRVLADDAAGGLREVSSEMLREVPREVPRGVS